ncbi:MAG: transposase [Candidatus Moranbacteria bacterium]|nr:transposase [Candidatus Moranbacteria bacterium]
MPSVKIHKESNAGVYFLTFSVKNLYYFFDRHYRWNILADSLKYCQKEKQLKIHAFVFMLNHLHLVISSPDVSGFVCDFKKFTSKVFRKNIENTEPNVLKLFLDTTGKYELWEKTNMPKIIETEEFYLQKVNYIHNNSVKKNYVAEPEHWYWSSANPRCEIKIDNIYS